MLSRKTQQSKRKFSVWNGPLPDLEHAARALRTHPRMEALLGVDCMHVIVDKDDFDALQDVLGRIQSS